MPVYLQYYFWLVLVSVGCFAFERIAPWRRSQRVFRRGAGQDLVWLFFNGHYLGLLLALGTGHVIEAVNGLLSRAGLPLPETLALLADAPLWLQFVVFLLLKDFVEWNVHRLLHNVPWLWEFHKLHHSIEELDWIGNFRFHWVEVIIYKTLSYVPLVVLGVDSRVLLAIAILWTVMLDLNHSNVKFSWGPLRYVLNSSSMHVWHHDVENHGRGGQNFGQVLSVWDWMFGTAYWPKDREMPERLGFAGMEKYPRGLFGRFFWPLTRLFAGRGSRDT